MVRPRSALRGTAVVLVATAATSVAVAMPAAATTRKPSVATLIARCTTARPAPGTTVRGAMFAQLQCIRRTAHLHRFSPSAPVAGVARRWSATMAAGAGLTHNPDMPAQVGAADSRWLDAGEIIGCTAAGPAEVGTVVTEWLRSPHHRSVLLDPSLTVVGIGVATADGTLWATVDLVDR